MNLSKQPNHNHSIIRFSYFLGLATLILVVINIVMSARVAQDGLAIDDLANQQSILTAEIAQLEQKLLTEASLSDISVKAAQLGYLPPQTNLTVTSIHPVAYNLSHE